MIDFKEEYKELYDSVTDLPQRRLETIPGEQRGDDCGSSIGRKFNNSELSLFLLSQKTSENGFVEKYCLSDEDAEKLKEIRKKLNDNSLWKETLINTLEQYLPISYEEFKKLDLGEQQKIIDDIKLKQEKDMFQERFEKLVMLPTSYSRKEKERIKKEEARILKLGNKK